MRFVVDECTGPAVAVWLVEQGHDLYAVSLSSPGWKDTDVLAKAVTGQRIVITNERDFGELIFKNRLPHEGAIYVRLNNETSRNKIAVLSRLSATENTIIDHDTFFTVTEDSVRMRHKKRG